MRLFKFLLFQCPAVLLCCQYHPDEDIGRGSYCIWLRRQDFTGRLIKGGSNVLSHMFNELWKKKREKVLTHAMSYLFALSFCDFYFISKTSKDSASRSSFQPRWEAATHPHPKIKGVLAVTGQRKIQSDEALTFKSMPADHKNVSEVTASLRRKTPES